MTEKEIISVSKVIDEIRANVVQGVNAKELDVQLYYLQMFIFDMEDKKGNN